MALQLYVVTGIWRLSLQSIVPQPSSFKLQDGCLVSWALLASFSSGYAFGSSASMLRESQRDT